MNTTTLRINELSAAHLDAMVRLLDHCFENVTRVQFDSDLDDKTHAILMHRTDGTLAGFSSLARYTDTTPDQQNATIVCSGDTIVHPDAWGTFALHRAWIRAARADHDDELGPIYWLLITSGFRTYRFLPVFFRSFTPHHACPALADDALLHHFARRRWNEQYNSETGIVRLRNPQRLRPQLRAVPPGRQDDPHIAHFLKRNPGHERGDELASLTDLSLANLTPAGRRMLGTESLACH